ncbi:Protein NifY [Candidatus Methylobacter favarea]|uniref:Protein NifY n=1 Tax=Candidatus Methylobacter favarea TaxID=2707345 RepID=A0A8S0WZB6_9GAMM|nr:dinitrogenase iron-molybdenum cofactor biosynthesis protein [Candidatus Methylobacter favarea]CAA9890085.1 Protein NifY [Candidatus Methylobacter favarea]
MSSQDTLSRELALRIGLAARALPDTDARRLFNVLTQCIGLPITEDKLGRIKLKTFKFADEGEFSDMNDVLLKKALHILKSGAETDTVLKPVIDAYSEDDMPGSVRIAFASNDGINIDGHFGSCSQFMIYQVLADEARLIDIRSTESPVGLEVDDKNLFRAELIQDCQVIYMASVGGPAAAKIVKLGIHPVKLPAIDPIAEVVSQLQTVIADTPPPWLAKVMGIEVNNRFRFDREATG